MAHTAPWFGGRENFCRPPDISLCRETGERVDHRPGPERRRHRRRASGRCRKNPQGRLRSVDPERFRVRPGDVLLSCRGTVLKAAPVLDDMGDTLASSNIITIRPAPAMMLPQLILALLRSSAWQETLRSRSRSSTALMQLTVKDVEDLPVPVPPLELQAKLAALVDAGDRAYRSAVEVASMRRALVDSIVTRALLDPAQEKIR